MKYINPQMFMCSYKLETAPVIYTVILHVRVVYGVTDNIALKKKVVLLWGNHVMLSISNDA